MKLVNNLGVTYHGSSGLMGPLCVHKWESYHANNCWCFSFV